MTCSICCESFNKSLNSKIICPISNCGFEACKTCVRTYLLSTTNDPHCMNCKNQWDHKFLFESLNKSYIENDYRKHRKQLLVDREISRTPELMNLVQRVSVLEEEEKQLQLLISEHAEARKYFNELSRKVQDQRLKIYRIKNGEDAGKDERRKFIMPCPAENCKGYLSSQYKCEVCKLFTCPDCFEIIGHSKDDHHECKQNDLASAQLIKKETKPCPKCGVRIFKISGCDQMWCTECKVAFSWNTGKIVISGAIHNPHYYQYMRNNGGDGNNAPRNPGDVLCGGMIPFHSLNSMIRVMNRFNDNAWFNLINADHTIASFIINVNTNGVNNFIITKVSHIFNILFDLHRLVNHITNVDLVNIRNKVRDLTNFDNLVVQYILNKKSKEQLATDIFRNDNLRKKSVELLNVYELLSVVSIERFNSIYNYYTQVTTKLNAKEVDTKIFTQFILNVVNFINEYVTLLDMSNRLLMQISYTYNMSLAIYFFESGKFVTKRHKFTQSEYNTYIKNIDKKIFINSKSDNNNHEASSSSQNQ